MLNLRFLRRGTSRCASRKRASKWIRQGSAQLAPVWRGAELHRRSPLPTRVSDSFRGSFSAGSTPIFASKYAFCSIFQNLQEYRLLASEFGKFLLKNRKNLQILTFFANFAKLSKIFRKFNPQFFCKILENFCRILQKCVDFEKC